MATRWYGTTIDDLTTFSLAGGEAVLFLVVTGKTTFLRAVAGMTLFLVTVAMTLLPVVPVTIPWWVEQASTLPMGVGG